MTMRVRTAPAVMALLMTAAACEDPLTAKNFNQPDIERIFSDPAYLEPAIASGYQLCRNAVASSNLFVQLVAMSLESYSPVNNYDFALRAAIPRMPIVNNKAEQHAEGNAFSGLQRNGRMAANAVAALDRLAARGRTLGSRGGNARARAFGFFAIGCNIGYGALVWDSLAMVDHRMASDSVPPLESAEAVMTKALAILDSALAMANTPDATAEGGFPTPSLWMSGTALTRDEFVKVVHTMKARFRSGVARTRAERDAVDWGAVLADAEAGVNHDIEVMVGGASGWSQGFGAQSCSCGLSNLSPMYYGFADVGGQYQAWLQDLPYGSGNVVIVTPDLRWPQGTTHAQQYAASHESSAWTDRPYIANRGGPGLYGEPWGWSYYDLVRYHYIRRAGGVGNFPEFLQAETDLMAAEAALRLGQIAKAAEFIDISRTRNGLPPLSGVITTATQPVPGGANCVPKVPDPVTHVLSCGTIFEAMKYEKRMETAFNLLGAWFFDSRGWGDLIPNTPLEYPLPVAEIDVRYPTTRPYYNLGGGGPSSAPWPGTYGLP